MYRISDETLRVNAFARGGAVRAISPHYFLVEPQEVPGLAVYIMRVNGEYMKGGHTGKKASSFAARMKSEFGCLRPVIAAGPPYHGTGDPWQRLVPLMLVVPGAIVELWVKSYTDLQTMRDDEEELNDFYRGLWTREGQPGWKPKARRRVTVHVAAGAGGGVKVAKGGAKTGAESPRLKRGVWHANKHGQGTKLDACRPFFARGRTRFFFYSADRHEPRHVHVERDANRAKFWLDPVRLARSGGFGAAELREVERLVAERASHLMEKWDEYFSVAD